MLAQGVLGEMTLIEGWLGRNDPTGAWEYPPPPDLSLKTLDWDTWQNDVPKRPLDGNIFARWRCWKEYGTGVAGDLLVHLISGMMFMTGINEPPRQAASVGGIRRWKDGRNMPDVHATIYTPDFDDTQPHLWNYFEAVRTRKPVVEDVVFGHNAALACHMANEAYFRRTMVSWDEATKTIRS